MDRSARDIVMGPARIDSLRKDQDAHKYDHGHALVLSGGPGATGAARLAARAALRIGAGLVTLGVPPAAQLEVAMHETSVMLRRISDAGALSAVLEDARITALCLGPGLGVGRAGPLLHAALGERRIAMVIDADALTALAEDASLMGRLHDGCILTPHMGEFQRLFPDCNVEGQDIGVRARAVRSAADRSGCAILLKGPDTMISAPDGTTWVHRARGENAAPWLATAGAGDVLAGMITGLTARGQRPVHAGGSAVWLHACAARRLGPGMIAEDLPEALPQVLASLGV